uniref:C-type lectin domain-containing protein n=1 Tax=Sparus aurata TaxID=8175 RepID=A0A671YHJ2_SPAAU
MEQCWLYSLTAAGGKDLYYLSFTHLGCISLLLKELPSAVRVTCRGSQAEVDRFNDRESFRNTYGWIGLYKDASETWRWSGGRNASFFRWSDSYTDEGGRCVTRSEDGFHKKNCDRQQSFYCFKSRRILVKENKTWEQALRHCRSNHTDLVHLKMEAAVIKTLQTSREAQTDYVWTSLRFLAHTWLWMNGDEMSYQAWSQGKTPQCSNRSHRCGALSLKGQHWVSWDCADRLNFVCY